MPQQAASVPRPHFHLVLQKEGKYIVKHSQLPRLHTIEKIIIFVAKQLSLSETISYFKPLPFQRLENDAILHVFCL